jgi:hypothetical protein
MDLYLVQGFLNFKGLHTGVQVSLGGLCTYIPIGAHWVKISHGYILVQRNDTASYCS